MPTVRMRSYMESIWWTLCSRRFDFLCSGGADDIVDDQIDELLVDGRVSTDYQQDVSSHFRFHLQMLHRLWFVHFHYAIHSGIVCIDKEYRSQVINYFRYSC